MNTFLATGYTGAAIVFLAALAYASRISQDPANQDPMLTASFIVLNALGWAVGGRIYATRPSAPAGIALLVLGDLLFPLNLFAPTMLYAPFLKGRVFHSAALVLLLGIAYQARNYLNMETTRFHPIFYPYFFAGAGAALLHLARPVLGLSYGAALGLSLAFALALFLVADRRSLQPSLHFSLAPAGVVFVTGLLSAWEMWRRPAPSPLGLLFVVSGILVGLAWVSGRFGPWSRLVGLAALACMTLAFTGTLRLLDAPPLAYLVGTVAWVLALAVLSCRLDSEAADPLQHGAYWLAAALGIGLVAGTSPVWLPLSGLPRPRLGGS